MNYLDQINKINEEYSLIRYKFSDNEYKHFESKDFKEGKLRGFFTPAYHKRKILIKNASILYGYIFRTNDTVDIDSKFIETRSIHSPMYKYRENPCLYVKTLQNLTNFLNSSKSLFYKKYKNALNSKFFECHFLKIPEDMVNGDEIYISYSIVRRKLNKDVHVGINYFFINKLISKEIMVVPDDIMNLMETKHNEKTV